MSARRPHGQSYADVAAKSPQEESSSDVTPAVPTYVHRLRELCSLPILTIFYSDVIYKLLGFTFAMVFAPIGMYFLTVKSIFSGMIEHIPDINEI